MNYQLIAERDYRLTNLEQILFNRGINPENLKRFKNPTADELHDPLLLENIQEGAKLLISHIGRNDQVFVQVDPDCDGYTSSAILINYLNDLFPHFAQTKITYRIHNGKEHGLLAETVPADTKLVIAPDSASNDTEEVNALWARGIDVLIIDHHHADRYLEHAVTINNQMCGYPNKTLSGAGVVWKFCCYIDSLIGTNYAEKYFDLATVGLEADVMWLTDFETRYIIMQGMKLFENPLLKTMVEKDDFHFGGQALTPFNITWYIAPYINAISRSGTMAEKQVVFESMIEYLAYQQIPSTKRGCKGQYETRVEQAVRACNNAKSRQTKAVDAAMDAIYTIIEKENLLENKILAIRLDPKYAVEKNLTGLCANAILSQFNRPVLILNKIVEDGKVYWRGSGRGYDKANLEGLRELLERSGYVEYASGHQSAFGTSVPDENYDDLVKYINEAYKDFNCAPVYMVDLIWQGNDVTDMMIAEIANEEKLWGKGCEDPVIAIEGLRLTGDQVRLLGLEKGKPTLRFSLPDGSSIVKFKSSEEEYNLLHSDLGYVIINAVGTCAKNTWNDTYQFKLIDYELVDKQDYYF